MRVLYYLEPQVELERPLFRLPTVRNHLNREIPGLLGTGEVEVAMLCSKGVAQAVRQERMLEGVTLFELDPDEITPVAGDYLAASALWYNRTFDAQQLGRMAELCVAALGTFRPDVIVCYESNAPFLAHSFPKALFLHNTLGIFSRAPYPETSVLDPFGIGKDAYLARFAEQIRASTVPAALQGKLDDLKESYRRAQLQLSPVTAVHVRSRFERVVLLPLQVSRYFMFDENCPADLVGGTQLDLVEYVLERLPRDIGVFVTMHGAEASLFTPEACATLQRRHPHFLFSEDIQRVRWASQHVLPHVDAVVTVSSSVGLQALVWDLPVVALGRSHVSGIATTDSLSELPALLSRARSTSQDGALFHLLTHYYPSMDRYHHRGEWFLSFLRRGLEKKADGLDVGFFEPIDDPQAVLTGLVTDLRSQQYAHEVRRSTRQGGPPLHCDKRELLLDIERADLVSFDVFDTLVTRPLSHPNALFELLAPQADACLGSYADAMQSLGGFRHLRELAAREAAAEANLRGSEEFDLPSVYRRLCELIGAPEPLVPALVELEVAAESAIHRPRESGRQLYEAAVTAGKRIALISDTFLDTAAVRRIVERAGYGDHAQLYVSSEHGVLKRSGKLYDVVREREGHPARWVHVGDNRLSDAHMASRRGIRAYHLASISDLYLHTPTVRSAWGPFHVVKSLGASLQHGVISRKFYDEPHQPPADSHFAGSPYRMGYEAGGPLMLGFVEWIVAEAKRAKLTDVYFLARDGHLPRKMYELVTEGDAEAPRAHYLYASRRAYNVASLVTTSDILSSLELKFSPMSLKEILSRRFGVSVDRAVAGSLEAVGFASWEDVVDIKDPVQRSTLERFLTANSAPILAQAATERDVLLDYLREEGLFDASRRCTIVDIGHNASLQTSLCRLTGRQDIRGLYFATFHPARRVYLSGLDIESYLVSFEDPVVSDHVYCRNVGMFEFLFLPAVPSLVRMERSAEGALAPVFVEGDEEKRFALIQDVHRGALDFCADIRSAGLALPHTFNASKNDSIRTYAHFVSKPTPRDANMLSGVSFVDAFGGSVSRYLIVPELSSEVGEGFGVHIKQSWWRAGAKVLANANKRVLAEEAQAQGVRRNARARAAKASNGSLGAAWERKVLKLLRNPKAFLRDAGPIRAVRRALRKP